MDAFASAGRLGRFYRKKQADEREREGSQEQETINKLHRNEATWSCNVCAALNVSVSVLVNVGFVLVDGGGTWLVSSTNRTTHKQRLLF